MRHPLGYNKIDLIRLFGYRVRLHVWSGPSVEDPHNHRWSFVSVPLWGRFEEVRYRSVPGFRRQLVSAFPDRGSGRSYVPAGDGSLLVLYRRSRYPLMPYRCRVGEIHSLRPRGFGISIVFLGKPRSDSSEVWR